MKQPTNILPDVLVLLPEKRALLGSKNSFPVVGNINTLPFLHLLLKKSLIAFIVIYSFERG